MPVIAIGAAIAATAFAAVDVAAVGLTVATAFEITAAVGATDGCDRRRYQESNALAKAGLADIGVVGGLGALASAAGLFGSTTGSSLFGVSPTASTGDAGDFSEGLTPATAGTSGGPIDSGTF